MTPSPRKAGRPKAEPTAVIRLRVPVDAHAAIVELGGDKWARRIILAALDQARSATPATQPQPAN